MMGDKNEKERKENLHACLSWADFFILTELLFLEMKIAAAYKEKILGSSKHFMVSIFSVCDRSHRPHLEHIGGFFFLSFSFGLFPALATWIPTCISRGIHDALDTRTLLPALFSVGKDAAKDVFSFTTLELRTYTSHAKGKRGHEMYYYDTNSSFCCSRSRRTALAGPDMHASD